MLAKGMVQSLALHDPASGLFWDAKAPPKPRLIGRSPHFSKTWKPTLLSFPTKVSQKIASARCADYACLRSFRSDLPDIALVEVSWIVQTKAVEVEGMETALVASMLRAHCPDAMVKDFTRLARAGFDELPTHAVKRAVGIGKRFLSEYCPSVVHGSDYSFMNSTDAVAVRLLCDAIIIDLSTAKKV